MKIVWYFLGGFFCLITAFSAGMFFFAVHNKVVDFSVLEYSAHKPSIILDDQGTEIGRFQLDKRDPIKLSQMPPHLIQAFVSAEDRSFFDHAGLSWKGILRSMLVNMMHWRKAQGASTITQQLTRLLFFNAKKTYIRKLKEQLLSLIIEQQFSKDQILEAYLNNIYFGCGIYGVEAASQRFWGKPAAQLSVDESALLAGIVKSPLHYCPLLSLDGAERRRNVVLRVMYECQVITQEAYEQAKAKPVILTYVDRTAAIPHLKEQLRIFLEDLVGKQVLYGDGLVIQTTINKTMQSAADKSLKERCIQLKQSISPDVDGALISMDVATGEIKALVGGCDFAHSKFNRATQARRQMGSVFKPLVYAAAINTGHTFDETEIDEPISIMQRSGPWEPRNYNRTFNGEMTLAAALSYSGNIIAIKTFLSVGAQPIIELARRCHLQGPFYPYPSLALGCVDVTLKEVTGMFNIFANAGTYVEPHVVKWVKDTLGKKIWRIAPEKHTVLHPRVSSQVARVLMLGIERAQKKIPGPWIDSQALGKTGTTNDSRTCWFAGSTPELTTVVYVGRDDNKPMGENIYPVRTAFPIWLHFHRAVSTHKKHFSFDPSLHECVIDRVTGQLVAADSERAITILK